MVDKLATVGLRDAFVHPGNKAGLIFQHPGNGVLHKLRGVLAIGKGHLLEPRFNVGREVYLHAPKVREKLAVSKIAINRGRAT